MVDFFIDLMPLFADVFERDNTTGESTARLLLDVVFEFGQVARDLPQRLWPTLAYVRLAKNQDERCSDALPNLEHPDSHPVDFSKERTYVDRDGSLVDNRSGLEQVVELFTDADTCYLGVFDKTISELLIDLLADRSEETVCNLIDTVLDILGAAIVGDLSEWVVVAWLNLKGCEGQSIWDGLQSLDTLAKSGLLDAFLPIASAFKSRAQLRTLLDIIHVIGDDLQKDQSGSRASTVRRALPMLVNILKSDAFESFIDLNDLLVGVVAVDHSGTLADVVVDSFEWVTDDRKPIQTRQGPKSDTSHALEMLSAYRAIAQRLQYSQALTALERIFQHLFGYLAEDPNAREPRLLERRLAPVLRNLLAYAGDVFDLPIAERNCLFDTLQSRLEDFLTGPELATSVRLMNIYSDFSASDTFDSLGVRLLAPQTAHDVQHGYAPLIKLGSALIQTPDREIKTQALLDYLAKVLVDENLDAASLLSTLDQLLDHDSERVLIQILEGLISPSPHLDGKTPVELFADLFVDLLSYQELDGCIEISRAPWSVKETEDAILAIVRFLTDPEYGLGAIYEIILNRKSELF